MTNQMTDCTCKTCSDYNDSQSYRTADGSAKCNPASLYHKNYLPVFCDRVDVFYVKTSNKYGGMRVCSVKSKSYNSLRKHRKKVPHYRKNRKPTFLERLLGRKEFSKRHSESHTGKQSPLFRMYSKEGRSLE